ncbi:MAG: CinA family nicotinamide mononucleotide deamidase-related protein [Porphyromonadaceae bacterium]|nr:CinA family nicotinamide mononucleotide deamidase-related protein [Porphyromonadaceae bacterium]
MIEIITIGNEILIGQIVDTNSAWMSMELNKAGFPISQITSIHDDEKQILSSLENAFSNNEIVLITGGLGPTNDDITKTTLCQFFDTELVFDQSVFENIKLLFAHRPSVMNELTKSQAFVPKNCKVIQNRVGTAPIMWFELNNKVVVSMPGVPFEMKVAMQEEIIPKLKKMFLHQHIVNQTVQVVGYGESALALKIGKWESELPAYLDLAYLPNFGVVKLRLSGSSEDKERLENEVNVQFQKLSEILGESIIAVNDFSLEENLFNLLADRNLTLSTAESCTGGNLARKIVSIPGASDVYKGSIVAYDYETKTNILNVSIDILHEFGAVSRQVVELMAANVRKLLKTDISVAISGIAGPGGGTDEKPVGTVWIAISVGGKITSKLFHFGNFPREVIIGRTTNAAIVMLIEELRR